MYINGASEMIMNGTKINATMELELELFGVVVAESNFSSDKYLYIRPLHVRFLMCRTFTYEIFHMPDLYM